MTPLNPDFTSQLLLISLLNYPTIVEQSDPLRNLWTFKYESKHQKFKKYARSITSRLNVPKSLEKTCIKSYSFNYFFIQKSEDCLHSGHVCTILRNSQPTTISLLRGTALLFLR